MKCKIHSQWSQEEGNFCIKITWTMLLSVHTTKVQISSYRQDKSWRSWIAKLKVTFEFKLFINQGLFSQLLFQSFMDWKNNHLHQYAADFVSRYFWSQISPVSSGNTVPQSQNLEYKDNVVSWKNTYHGSIASHFGHLGSLFNILFVQVFISVFSFQFSHFQKAV